MDSAAPGGTRLPGTHAGAGDADSGPKDNDWPKHNDNEKRYNRDGRGTDNGCRSMRGAPPGTRHNAYRHDPNRAEASFRDRCDTEESREYPEPLDMARREIRAA